MRRVLRSERGQSEARASKTVVPVRFDVPPGVRALALRFDYGPRVGTDAAENLRLIEAAFELHTRRRRGVLPAEEIAKHREALGVDARAKAGLNNLMNVTLIDPQGRWRGRWDRNPSSDDGSLLLGEAHASRGFIPGPIHEGTWTAAIECHGVFGAPVDWELTLEAREPPSDAEIEKLRSLAVPAKRTRRAGPGWYLGEMHSHTVHSDGKWEVEELASRIAATGADFLCLTDHNTLSGHLAPPDLPVTLIRGIELTTFHGHHPVYAIREMVPWHEDGRVLSLAEVAPRVRAEGGLVGVAHPFVPGDPLCTGCRMPEHVQPSDLDTMEVWYRRWNSAGADNDAARALWTEHWRNGHRIVGVGARDVHGPEQEGPFPGEMPLTAVYAEDNTPEAILAGVRAGRVVVSGGPRVVPTLEGNGAGRAGLGETLRSAKAPTLTVEVTGLEAGAELCVLAKGDIVERAAVTADGVYEFSLAAHGPGWYRAELWANGTPRALSNHLTWSAADASASGDPR